MQLVDFEVVLAPFLDDFGLLSFLSKLFLVLEVLHELLKVDRHLVHLTDHPLVVVLQENQGVVLPVDLVLQLVMLQCEIDLPILFSQVDLLLQLLGLLLDNQVGLPLVTLLLRL